MRSGNGKTSKFEGVCWDNHAQKWRAQIHQDGRCITIGRFESEIDAARAYRYAKLIQAKIEAKPIMKMPENYMSDEPVVIGHSVSTPVSIYKPALVNPVKQPKTTKIEDFLNPDINNIGVFDIETSGLQSDFAMTYCAVLKEFEHKSKEVFKLDLFETNLIEAEKYLIEEINNALREYDGIITYYGSRFDVPFIRTRSFYHGIVPLGKIPHLDAYFTVKRTVNPTTRRMDRINEILLAGKPLSSPHKTRISIMDWNKIISARNVTSLEYVVDHCVADVDILENLVKEFRMFLPDRVYRR